MRGNLSCRQKTLLMWGQFTAQKARYGVMHWISNMCRWNVLFELNQLTQIFDLITLTYKWFWLRFSISSPMNYVLGFVALCFVLILVLAPSDSSGLFTHILQGYLTGTAVILWVPYRNKASSTIGIGVELDASRLYKLELALGPRKSVA